MSKEYVNKWSNYLITLLLLMQACLHQVVLADDDDDDDIPSSIVIKDGIHYIELTEQRQNLSGIKTQNLESIRFQQEMQAFANVMPVVDLIKLKNAYQLQQAEIAIAENNYRFAELNFNKLNELNKTTANVQAAKLREARAQRDIQFSTLKKHRLKLATLELEMKQEWGKQISNITLKDESGLLDELLENKKSLLMMSLKPTQSLPDGIDRVFISRDTDRLSARMAKIISASNKIDNLLQGETYFLETETLNLRPGMRLYAWIPEDKNLKWGVVIGDEALVWHAGQMWAYIQINEEQFVRKALIKPIDTGDGWFVQENFEEGDRIVVQGAQLLLSEEYRGFIPDEDDDP